MLEQPMREVVKLHRLVEAKDRALDYLRQSKGKLGPEFAEWRSELTILVERGKVRAGFNSPELRAELIISVEERVV